MPLRQILNQMNHTVPPSILYHYTSLDTAQKILSTKQFWASEIHYMSDSMEMANASALIANAAAKLVTMGEVSVDVMVQFIDWVKLRFLSGHALFVVCFSEEGNQLSQWRGYTPPGKGVSLGFQADELFGVAASSFRLAKCVYERDDQLSLITAVVRAVNEEALRQGEDGSRHPKESYRSVFETLELDLLQIAALMKYGAFHEENEWRLVSAPELRTDTDEIHYRSGPSMLIPYKLLDIPKSEHGRVFVDQIYVGPTPHPTLSISSFSNFASLHCVDAVTSNSGIPYRTW